MIQLHQLIVSTLGIWGLLVAAEDLVGCGERVRWPPGVVLVGAGLGSSGIAAEDM